MSFNNVVVNSDIITVFKPLIDRNKYIVPVSDGKIHNREELLGLDIAGPYGNWLYVNTELDPDEPNNCLWRHDISELFGYPPRHCLNCWKVVVKPRFLTELFDLLKLMQEMVKDDPTVYCKCGIETREYVNGNYGGYFYHRSKEAMQERYKQVRKLVDERISPDVDVIPKLGCSEFELKYGPSDKYEELQSYTSGYADHWENMIKENCVMKPINGQQPELVQRPVIRGWIKFAWDRGDPTVHQFLGDEPLHPAVVRYYPE